MKFLFLTGAALSASHLLVGLLLMPFFGQGPFLWANVFAAFILSLGGGLFLWKAIPPRWLTAERAPYAFAAAGGLLLSFVPLSIAPVARAVLDGNPDSWFSAVVTTILLLVIPGLPLAAVLPALLSGGGRRRSQRRPEAKVAIAMLGASLGIAVCMPALLSAEVPAAPMLGLLGAALAVLASFEIHMVLRFPVILLSLAAFTGCLVSPGELGSVQYRSALARGFQMRVGRYYLATAGRRVLRGTEIRRRYEDFVGKLEKAPDKPAAAILLVVDTLRALGPVTTTGAGLQSTLSPLVPKAAARFLEPFFERVEELSSDGLGTINFVMKPGMGALPITIPRRPRKGEMSYKLLVKGDFSIALIRRGRNTELRIGPHLIQRAGFLEVNETHETPLVIQDVALFVDAHLLGVSIENRPDCIAIRVKAQGSIGGVKNDVVQVVQK